MFFKKKILIIAPSWVGDVVMLEPLLALIKEQSPNAIIDVLANKILLPIFKYMPEINQGLALPFTHGELKLKERYKFACTLRKANYDQAIILPNSFKSALIPFFAGIKQRTGWRGEMRYGLINDLRILDKNILPLMVERFSALGIPPNEKVPEKFKQPKLSIPAENILVTQRKFNLENTYRTMRVLIFCPGAEYGESKRWPAEYFAKIAETKSKDGFKILLLGSPKDSDVASKIQQHCNNVCTDLTGKTSLAEAADLISAAQVVISNDSGLMHVTAALDRPLIAIFGSTSPEFTPPLSDNAKILTLNLPCSPCFKRVCPLGTSKCLQDLKPEMVINLLNKK